MALSISFNWLCGTIIAQIFPLLVEWIKIWRTFTVFGLVCIAG